MTVEETITLVKECGFNVETTKHSECEKVVLNALKKQIPKKPTPHTVEPVEAPIKIGNINWGRGTTIYYCPNCKDFISRVYTYCHKCGQALLWESEDKAK